MRVRVARSDAFCSSVLGGHHHQGGGDHQRHRIAVLQAAGAGVLVVADLGEGQRGEGGADVDGGVEVAERLGEEGALLLLLVHLAHQRAGVGLDGPGAEREQAERDEQAGARLQPPEDDVPEHVGAREVEDGLVPAEHPVGEEAAEQGRQVRGRDERVHDGRAVLLLEEEHLRHVERQHGAHAVERRAFGELAPEDEPEALGVFFQSCDRAHTCATVPG